jgi:hypothetical protein
VRSQQGMPDATLGRGCHWRATDPARTTRPSLALRPQAQGCMIAPSGGGKSRSGGRASAELRPGVPCGRGVVKHPVGSHDIGAGPGVGAPPLPPLLPSSPTPREVGPIPPTPPGIMAPVAPGTSDASSSGSGAPFVSAPASMLGVSGRLGMGIAACVSAATAPAVVSGGGIVNEGTGSRAAGRWPRG